MTNIIAIARVIMTEDGNVHIALDNKQTVLCTNHNLLSLICDPYDFVDNSFKKCTLTTRDINTKAVPLEDIPGLTLATIYSDKSLKCEFPEMFLSIKDKVHESEEIPISFKNYNYKTAFTDNKEI